MSRRSVRDCQCGRPTAGEWLCERCTTTLRWSLVNVAAHFSDLETIETKQTRYATAGPSKRTVGKTQPLPVDTRFVNATGPIGRATASPGNQLRWDAWNTVCAWTRTVMEDHPERPGPVCGEVCMHVTCAHIRRSRWPENTVQSMIFYLARQFSAILREQWVEDMLDEMLDLELRLTQMVNRPADRWYAGRCGYADEYGRCDRELYAVKGRLIIDCDSCGTRHDVAARRDNLLTEAADRLVTATEAAVALIAWTDTHDSQGRLVDRIRTWGRRRRLAVRGTTRGERHLYRLGDIQALMVEHAQAEAKKKPRATC